MRTTFLHRARWLQHLSTIIGAISAIAGLGFLLTSTLFPSSEPTARQPTVTITTATTATTATPVAASHSNGIWTTLGLTLGASAAVAAAAAGVTIVRRRVRNRVDRKVAELEDRGWTVEDAAASVLDAEDVPDEEVELVHQRIRRRFVQEAALGLRDLEYFEFLPARPRSVKRAWNDFLLRAGLAIQRGLLTDEASVRVDHLSKWIVLSHTWPTVARAVQRAPEVLDRLERAHDVGVLEGVLESAGARISGPDRLLRFVQLEPPLAPIFDDLARLQLTVP